MDSQFKFKPDKIKYLSIVDTLDSTHKKIIEGINKKREDIPQKTIKLEKLEKDLEKLEKESISNQNYLFIRANLLEEISNIKEELGNVIYLEDETEYYAKTYQILFNYYDILDGQIENELELNITDNNLNSPINSELISKNIENKKNIENNVKILNQNNLKDLENSNDLDNINIKELKNNLSDRLDKINDENFDELIKNDEWNFDGIQIFNSVKSSKLDKLNELSKLKRKEKKITRKRVKNVESLINDKNYNIFDFIHSGIKTDDSKGNIKKGKSNDYNVYDRAILYEDYRTTLEGYSFKKKNSKPCITCAIDKVLICSEGIYVCMKCGEIENYIVESEITNYKDPMVEKPTFPYKRKNHFCEWTNYLYCSSKLFAKQIATYYINIINF